MPPGHRSRPRAPDRRTGGVPSRRARTLVATALLGLLLAGCGSVAAPPHVPPVRLRIAGPLDAGDTSSAQLTVRGTVRPAQARVEVLGAPVRVSRTGAFTTRIALGVGPNLIDVIASAPRAAGAEAVIRVTRFLLVAVPDVSGSDPRAAAATLRGLGLTPRVQSDSGPFSFLLPITVQVCGSSPPAGSRVDPGAAVTLRVATFCGL